MFSNFPKCVKLGIGYRSEYGPTSKWKVRSGLASKQCRSTTLIATQQQFAIQNFETHIAQKNYCINFICLKNIQLLRVFTKKIFNIVALASYLVCGNGFKGSKLTFACTKIAY
jgi:hypothetical protein